MKKYFVIMAVTLLLASCGKVAKQGGKVIEKEAIEKIAKGTISKTLKERVEVVAGKEAAPQLIKSLESNPDLLSLLEKNGNLLNSWVYLNKQLPTRSLDCDFVKMFALSEKYSKTGYFGGNKIENFVFKEGSDGEVLISSKLGEKLGKISTSVEPPLVTLYEVNGAKTVRNMFANLHPFPNAQYDLAGVKYKTDSWGRIIEGDFSIDKSYVSKPNIYYPKDITAAGKVKGALTGDDGGHLFGQQFGGSSSVLNVVPMKSTLNRGDYLAMERLWKKAADEGKIITAKVKLKYGNDATERPSWIEVTYDIDGEKVTKLFKN